MNGENKICRCFPSLFFVSDQDINSLNSLLRFFLFWFQEFGVSSRTRFPFVLHLLFGLLNKIIMITKRYVKPVLSQWGEKSN